MNRHSAAFFDLDRTLISGSSVFVLGVAAWRGKLVPSHQFVRDAASAIAFRLKGASDDTSNDVRDRILAAVAAGIAVQVNSTDRGDPDIWMLATEQDASSVAHWLRKCCLFRLSERGQG